MARRKRPDLFDEASRARAQEAIVAIEAQTSAEIVIVLKRRSSDYRHASAFGASLCALLTLGVLVFHPVRFDAAYFPIEVAIAWVLGALLTSRSERAVRALAGQRSIRESVSLAASAAFLERGISKTRSRTGVLVYLSGLERAAEVVVDVGVVRDPDFERQVERLREAMRTLDPGLVLPAIEALATPLSQTLPRAEDDVNELSDAVEAAS